MSNIVNFEGFNVEFLTKEDVNFGFNGDVLFNGKQSGELLDYKNVSDALSRHVRTKDKYKVKNSDIVNPDFRKLNNAGETFITENGIMKLIINSDMPKAEDFEDKVFDVVKQVRNTGRYDVVENKIMEVEDDKLKQLQMKLYKMQQVFEVDPHDRMAVIMLKDAENELRMYQHQKELDEVKSNVKQLQEKVNRTISLREGDRTAEAVARNFNIFSANSGKPHGGFADHLAKVLGIYLSPDGNVGHSDEYISVGMRQRGGVEVPTIKYSTKAVELMDKYINEEGLNIERPPQYYQRGDRKGKFNKAKIIFDTGNIWVNEVTYKLYTDIEE